VTPPQVGDELAPLTIESVSPEHMKTMAVVLDDPNQIHLDPEAVKALGMGDRVINQGPTGVGYLLNMLATAFPEATVEEIDLRFMANVLGGDTVVAGGKVTEIADGTVTCEVTLDVDGGAKAIAGTATLALPA
jgi:3-hydroxybutyryl-CoA dehydratase